MKQRTLLKSALTLLLVAFGTGFAHADLVPWGYDWSASPPNVTAGGGSVALSNESFHTAVGPSQVVTTNLKEFSGADPLSPDTFGPTDGKYTLTLKLKDLTSDQTATLVFKGQLQGKFSSLNSAVSNTFDPLTQSQTVKLGNTQYTVTLDAYTPPGPPSQGNLGSIGALVEVKDVSHVPEPASVSLFALGGATVGLVAWRRRRKAAAPPAT